MLTIGEFSNICRVSTKTLRYYAEIGLILPDEINPENGYRYYSIEQLEKMLLINRLKNYCFSLEEIKLILESEERMDEVLFTALNKKKKEIAVKVQKFENTLHQIDSDILNMRNGKSIMSYMENIDVRLVEIPMMYLLSIRKNVLEHEFSEFAIPIKEYATGTRDFCPGLCLKTVVQGFYLQLSSVYARQIEWAEREGYENSNALYEVYVTDPAEVSNESELITEVYYPVKKRVFKDQTGKQIL